METLWDVLQGEREIAFVWGATSSEATTRAQKLCGEFGFTLVRQSLDHKGKAIQK